MYEVCGLDCVVFCSVVWSMMDVEGAMQHCLHSPHRKGCVNAAVRAVRRCGPTEGGRETPALGGRPRLREAGREAPPSEGAPAEGWGPRLREEGLAEGGRETRPREGKKTPAERGREGPAKGVTQHPDAVTRPRRHTARYDAFLQKAAVQHSPGSPHIPPHRHGARAWYSELC